MNKVSASSEDYLKTIVAIGGSPSQFVRSVEIARRMRVSKTAVSKAIAQLKKAGLAEQARYGQVLLTDEGFAYGQELCKRHLYLFTFLRVPGGCPGSGDCLFVRARLLIISPGAAIVVRRISRCRRSEEEKRHRQSDDEV